MICSTWQKMRKSYETHLLHDVLPFLRELEREKQKQFEAYFRTAPLWLMDLFQSEIMEAGTTFIRENEPADTIFFVARGRVKATDYRISGIAYDFMKPMNLIALGGMEVILGQDTYHKEKLNGIVELSTTVKELDRNKENGMVSETEVPVKLIPYSTWNNRGNAEMAVWIPASAGYAKPTPELDIASRAKSYTIVCAPIQKTALLVNAVSGVME